MEPGEIYKNKLKSLKDAYSDFKGSFEINFSSFGEKEIDVFKSGQIQKFEFSVELLWKVMQRYLYEKVGEDVSGPKPVVKAFYNNNLINEEIYKILFEMIEARNKLSHLYDKKSFEEIYIRLKDFLNCFEIVIQILSNK